MKCPALVPVKNSIRRRMARVIGDRGAARERRLSVLCAYALVGWRVVESARRRRRPRPVSTLVLNGQLARRRTESRLVGTAR